MTPKLNQGGTDHSWIEYGLIIVLTVVVIAIIVTTMGAQLHDIFANLYRHLNGH